MGLFDFLRKKKKNDDLISYQSGNEMIIMPSRFQESSLGSSLGYLLIGLIIGAMAIGFLVVPGVENKVKQEMKDQMVQMNETLSSNAQQIQSQMDQIAQLENQIAVMQGSPEQMNAYEALLSGYVAYIANDYMTAGANLERVDTEQLSQSALELYNSIWPTVSETYYEALFTAGYNSYQAENFADTITNMLLVVKADMSYKEGSAAYYLAQAYRKNGDMESAKPYYQYVIDNFPGTQQANTSMSYLNGN